MLTKCPHQASDADGEIAVVAVGNTLRSDDGVAQAIVNRLPEDILSRVCRFDVGSYTNLLIECLSGHRSAVIVDSIQGDSGAGSIVVVDLAAVLKARGPVDVKSCHGFSIVDELRLAAWRGLLPEKIKFMGIEVASTEWGEGLSGAIEAIMPELTLSLESTIESLLNETSSHA